MDTRKVEERISRLKAGFDHTHEIDIVVYDIKSMLPDMVVNMRL